MGIVCGKRWRKYLKLPACAMSGMIIVFPKGDSSNHSTFEHETKLICSSCIDHCL